MQTNAQMKKPASRRPEVRSIKIQSCYRRNKYSETNVAEIRLSGNWLEKLGFNIDRRVTITTMNELLIIRLQPE